LPGETALPLQHSVLIERTEALVAKTMVMPTDRKSNRQYAGVSFRAGGATALGEAGVPDRVIQELGRWKSFTYARYVHTSEYTINNTLAKL
jgi:hypothetical protein